MFARGPRRSIRLRLTATYAALFLISGAVLLTIGYQLVVHVLPDPRALHGPLARRSNAAEAAVYHTTVRALVSHDSQQRTDELHRLLVDYVGVLAALSLLSIALGWLVAGRVLRPLRTITSTTRHISARNLHERLALAGPDDELKELGDTIDGLLARLERSFAFQRRFVANASHELRTPLALQQALLEATLTDPEANPGSWRATCERLLASGQHQAQLITSLVALARSEQGLERHEPVDIAQIAERALSTRQGDAERHGLTLTVQLDTAPACGDPQLIDRLIANLLDNAIRHNINHGWIQVTTTTTNGHAVFSTANTGPGVTAADLPRLLEPFQRLGANRTDHDGGLGLGLSIVHAIATAHDAQLDIRPRRGGGLEIDVRFTLRTSREPRDRNHTPQLTSTGAAVQRP